MLRNVSPGLIENVKDLKISLNELTVYDFDVYSSIEVYYKIAHKLNDIIRELSRFEGLVSEEVIKQNNKLIYLLGEGLENEVIKEIDNLREQNFFDDLVNVTLIKELHNRIDNVSSQLEYVANKGTTVEVLERVTKEEIERQIEDGTITNLTIGERSIASNKVKYKTLNANNLDFINYTKNIFNKNDIIDNSFLDQNTGENVYNDRGWFTTNFIKVKPNTLYTTNFDGMFRYSFEYDKDLKAIGNINGDSKKFTTSSTCEYIKLVITYDTDITYYGIQEGEVCFDKNEDEFIEFGYVEIPKLIINDNNNNNNEWLNKNVVVFGDSISTDYYANYTKWASFLQADLGFKLYNNSVHAVGFKCGASSQDADENTLSRKIESFYNSNRDLKVDVIIIFMGINDFIKHVPLGSENDGMDDSFEGAVKHCMGKIMDYWCNSRVYVITPLLHCWDKNHLDLTVNDYSNIIRKYANKYSYPVLDFTINGGFYPENKNFRNRWTYLHDGVNGDGVHPNLEFERDVMTNKIKSFITSN